MSTLEISRNEMLDHALVQCLRLFAQRGRMLRNQQLSSDDHTMERERAKTASEDVGKEVDNQK